MTDRQRTRSLIAAAQRATSDPTPGKLSVGKWRNIETRRPQFVDTVDQLKDMATRRTVFVTGGDSPPDAAERRRLSLAGWDVKLYGGRWPTLRRDGITVRWFHPWTGGAPVNAADAAQLWDVFTAYLADLVPGGRPLSTPPATGVDLWLRSLDAKACYPAPNPRLAAWLRSIAHQGRVEVLPPWGMPVPAVTEYDMRRAYLACLRDLPAGDPVLTVGPELPPSYTAGYALIDWHRPNDWHHCGIFRQGRRYPLTSVGAEWVPLAEVELARRHRWGIEVHAVVAFPHKVSPFRRWLDRVEQARSYAGHDPFWTNLWRALTLGAIGSLHGTPRKVRHLPAGVGDQSRVNVAASNLTPPHPEWTSAIWNRARLRLLDAPSPNGRVGAWHMPAAQVLGFRTDCLYLTTHPGWDDDGKLGRYRLRRVGGARQWPTNEKALIADLYPVPTNERGTS